jgi:tRNA A-37 threonylcarbamoyl transferase component Bud32/tetratricopeptide (TPR) repeat protein
MACLDDPTVLRFIMGRLDDISHRRVEEEVGRCGRCAALVAELVREQTTAGLDRTAELDGDPGDLAEGSGEKESPTRYMLGAQIARGGMGTILAAFDRRHDRPVAVKRLDSDRPLMAARFAREIKVTASLQHPGIVPLYDSGRLPDGRLFYAMRHVPGASLEQEIARRQSHSERLALLVPVLAAAEAVAYAHERGVIHRDLKPSNILVGQFGETVVIDWGLARTENGSADAAALHRDERSPGSRPPSGDPLTTVDGAVLGTPRYMAPEQARGEQATVASDVYALGAILYHALSGSPPVAATELRAVLEQVGRGEVTPLGRVVPGLPGDLAAIVERAMAARPEERYATAGELAADLRRFQTGQLVAAYAYSRRDLVGRFLRRHRAAVALAGLCAVVIAVVAVVSVRRIVGEREQAEAQRGIAERERAGAEDLVHFLLYDLRDKLNTVGRLDVLSGVADRVESYYLTTAEGRAEQPATLRARAELNDLRAVVAINAGDGAEADERIQRGMALLERLPSDPRTDEVRAALFESMSLRAARRTELERSRALALEAVKLRRALQPVDPEQRRRNDVELTFVLNRAAIMAERMGKPADAEREWQEAIAVLEPYRAQSRDDLDIALRMGEIHLAVGQNRYRRGELDGAQRALDLALATGTALAGGQPKNAKFQNLVAWTCISLADVAMARGQLGAAQGLNERGRESARFMSTVEPASATWQSILARAEMNLGQLSLARADWSKAVEHLQEARAAYEQIFARDPSTRENRRAAAVATARLAEAETELGRADSARATWRAALVHLASLAESGVAKARMEWANGLRIYAAFERWAGRPADADAAVDKALALIDSTPRMVERPIDANYRAGVLLEVGRSHAAHHRKRQARAAWQRGVEILRAEDAEAPLDADSAPLLDDLRSELAGRHPRQRGRGRR